MHRPLHLAAAVLLVLSLSRVPAHADEGMWMPEQLPALGDRLEERGLELDPEQLTDLTGHPMGAIVSLGGCSASFVSPRGLVLTNHHCAYGSIQYNSTDDNDLLEDGFLAEDLSTELTASPGTRVYVTTEVTEVTDKILAAIPGTATGAQRFAAIEGREKALVAACEADPGHRCNVREYFGGLEYYLVKQLEIRDVRLVYAPSKDVGKYGGNIDNWMWPRHTGDWSYFRAYVAPDGKPADYSERNVPYQPEHWLRLAEDGLQAGDYVMAIGYPGNTSRYRTAAEVQEAFDWVIPRQLETYEEWLAVIERMVATDDAAAARYSPLIAGLNNVIKNSSGQLQGFAAGDTLERKQARDRELTQWIAADEQRQQEFGGALANLEALVAKQRATREREIYYPLATGSTVLDTAERLYRLSTEREKPDAEREPGYQERDLSRIKASLARMERRFAPVVDKAVWNHFILEYSRIPPGEQVKAFNEFFGFSNGTVASEALIEKLNYMYAHTGLTSLEARMDWLTRSPAEFRESDDPFIELAVALYESSRALEAEAEALAGEFARARYGYMAALVARNGDQGDILYPDANSTMRVTFGSVKGYRPRDALQFLPFTTLDGIVEKHTGEWPFDAPEKLLQAIAERDYGAYYDPGLNSVPVDFLSNVDTTGGNSGSPTLNGKGQLVGLVFDGTYDSIISDWAYDDVNTRSIHVSTQYMLWVMDGVDGADRLLEEMGVDRVSSRGASVQIR